MHYNTWILTFWFKPHFAFDLVDFILVVDPSLYVLWQVSPGRFRWSWMHKSSHFFSVHLPLPALHNFPEHYCYLHLWFWLGLWKGDQDWAYEVFDLTNIHFCHLRVHYIFSTQCISFCNKHKLSIFVFTTVISYGVIWRYLTHMPTFPAATGNSSLVNTCW